LLGLKTSNRLVHISMLGAMDRCTKHSSSSKQAREELHVRIESI
jgi:hypothetical protein